MVGRKCAYCGDEKLIKIRLKDYIYKKKDKSSKMIDYFCSYECMRKAEKENSNKYYGKRNI